jgi:hypothetical protein
MDKRKRGEAEEIISRICGEYKSSDLRADNRDIREALNRRFEEIKNERENLRHAGVGLVGKHLDELIAIREENGEWLFQLIRLGIAGKPDDISSLAERIAERLEGSRTAAAIRSLLAIKKVS